MSFLSYPSGCTGQLYLLRKTNGGISTRRLGSLGAMGEASYQVLRSSDLYVHVNPEKG